MPRPPMLNSTESPGRYKNSPFGPVRPESPEGVLLYVRPCTGLSLKTPVDGVAAGGVPPPPPSPPPPQETSVKPTTRPRSAFKRDIPSPPIHSSVKHSSKGFESQNWRLR